MSKSKTLFNYVYNLFGVFGAETIAATTLLSMAAPFITHKGRIASTLSFYPITWSIAWSVLALITSLAWFILIARDDIKAISLLSLLHAHLLTAHTIAIITLGLEFYWSALWFIIVVSVVYYRALKLNKTIKLATYYQERTKDNDK